MTEQSGGQTPAGWYPDGQGALRYWDGTAWTEHTAPMEPAAPGAAAADAGGAAAPTGTTGVADAAVGTTAATAATDVTGSGAAPDVTGQGAETPFYKKPAVLIAGGVALLLILGGAAIALSGGDDNSAATPFPTNRPSSSATLPATATQAYTLNCQAGTSPVGSYPFDLTMTVSSAVTAGQLDLAVEASGSIRSADSTIVAADTYRFEAAVTVNGTVLQLVGPMNTSATTGPNALIFPETEWPLVAKGSTTSAGAAVPTVVLTDLYFNNVSPAPTATDSPHESTDTRCNASPQPNAAPQPIGLTVPSTGTSSVPGATTPGVVTPGAVTPGATTPGAVTPGAVTPGVTPGAVTPGAVTPGAVVPTTPAAGGLAATSVPAPSTIP